MSGDATITQVTFEVLRYNPETDDKPHMQTFEVPAPKGMTVLDGLLWIKENLDPSLSWRSSCRMGVCGSCGMFINGLPRLACANQIAHLHSDTIVVKPLPNYDIIKDLVPDLEDFFHRHRTIKPYLIRKEVLEQESPTSEYFQSQQELVNYIQFAYCIKCGCCLSACPTVATDRRYLGPQALSQAYRYIADSRDEGFAERENEVFSDHGAYRCHFAGACSEVCPKGVDPAMAIQLLKQQMFVKKMGVCKEKHAGAVLPAITEAKENPKIPKAPAPTIK
jgi:succinate dehydrogenase / fumarate reductase iron-sulfur subunit